MSIFDKIKEAFHPVEQAVHGFSAEAVAKELADAIEKPIRDKLPGHLSLHEVVEVVKIAEPSAVECDIFAGFGISLGIELELEFDVGITIEHPAAKIEALVELVENPPETTHQLLDRLWSIAPSEVRVSERLQAIIGEQVAVKWYGDDVLERVVQYIAAKGWLEKRLRP